MYDRVQKLGLTAYRTVMHRIGPNSSSSNRSSMNTTR
uniref:Uncharacterized protein n=1 Tax=Arundo donax TaxID=35708 RepID=A0A0A9C042_ARUDO